MQIVVKRMRAVKRGHVEHYNNKSYAHLSQDPGWWNSYNFVMQAMARGSLKLWCKSNYKTIVPHKINKQPLQSSTKHYDLEMNLLSSPVSIRLVCCIGHGGMMSHFDCSLGKADQRIEATNKVRKKMLLNQRLELRTPLKNKGQIPREALAAVRNWKDLLVFAMEHSTAQARERPNTPCKSYKFSQFVEQPTWVRMGRKMGEFLHC